MNVGSSELLLDPRQPPPPLPPPSSNPGKSDTLANVKARTTKEDKFWKKREKFLFYTTLCLSMTTVGAGTSILFLVPLYVDPALSTLIADFVPHPVTCTTTRREDFTGLFNCTWSSCREGCTSDFYKCSHIYVTYAEVGGQSHEAVLLVNIKGCGYPPTIKCNNFTAFYGVVGFSFPCHYSRQNKTVAMHRYERSDQVKTIVHFFLVPFFITILSSLLLCLMHCNCRSKASYQTNSDVCSDSGKLVKTPVDEGSSRGKSNIDVDVMKGEGC